VFIDITTGTGRHAIFEAIALRVPAFVFFVFLSAYRFEMIYVPAFCQLAAAICAAAFVFIKHQLSFFLSHSDLFCGRKLIESCIYPNFEKGIGLV
jgi:hypothetical protein